jgi:hypothetical protein
MADCTYTVDDLDASGDALYGPSICSQPFVDFAGQAHGFNNTYWQDGWGFDDPCNNTKPLGRVFNAIWLLNYSARDYENEDWGNDILHWGRRYVREQFKSYDDLRARCGNSPVAKTTGCQQTRQFNDWKCTQEHEDRKKTCREWSWVFAWICFLWSWIVEKVCDAWGWVSTAACTIWYGTVGGGQHIDLFLAYFYTLGSGGDADVISRAATLVHESRHIGNKPHDAQFPAGSIFGGGSDGADSSWGYEGAWMFDALYLWWFYAEGDRTSVAMRQAAKQRGNVIIMNAFATNPGFLIA